jgi:hypothetical protein
MRAPATGTDWLRYVQRISRRVKREDPAAFTVLMTIRDSLLDAAAAGVIDLHRPLTVCSNDEGVFVEQPQEVTP